MTPKSIKTHLRELYFGKSAAALRFRVALLIFDLVTLAFFIATTALPPDSSHWGIDYLVAAIILADLGARTAIADKPWRHILLPLSIVDAIVVFSLVAHLFFESLLFLRVLRMLRLLRSYHVIKELRENLRWFRQNEDFVQSATNLLVFIFFISAIVFVVEGRTNPGISNFLDALYFTVTSLTTTGYGDITMSDTKGRVLTIVIMVVGVALFLRLAQTLFRPSKVAHTCPDCGLTRHDPDAVHCKHCGKTIKIETEGGD